MDITDTKYVKNLRYQFKQPDSLNINKDGKNSCNTNYKLICGDFFEQSQKEIEDNSIDLIFTDPPYGKEYLSLYQELARLASRVLKRGGCLVTYVGHIILDEVLNI
jgi:predicted methyltransferase